MFAPATPSTKHHAKTTEIKKLSKSEAFKDYFQCYVVLWKYTFTSCYFDANEVTFSVHSLTFVSSISDGGEFQHPCDIAVDYKRDDRLIVTDFNNNRVQVREGTYTAKHAQLATKLLTSCNRLVINKPISECVRMACDSLLTTNLLKVVDRLVFKTCYSQACCKLFQQVVTSLQMTSCNKPVFNRLVTT